MIRIVPPNISGSLNATACVNNGIVPSASPAASAQYQNNLWLPMPVMDIPLTYGCPPSESQPTQLSLACNRKDKGTVDFVVITPISEIGCTDGASSMLKPADV